MKLREWSNINPKYFISFINRWTKNTVLAEEVFSYSYLELLQQDKDFSTVNNLKNSLIQRMIWRQARITNSNFVELEEQSYNNHSDYIILINQISNRLSGMRKKVFDCAVQDSEIWKASTINAKQLGISLANYKKTLYDTRKYIKENLW